MINIKFSHSIINGLLKGEKEDSFKDKMTKEGKWDLYEDVDNMWNETATCIKRVVKDVLGES